MLWGRGFALVSIGNERLWIPFRLIWITFDWKGRAPETCQVIYMHTYIHTYQQRLQMVFPGLDHYLNFVRVP